MLLRSGSFMVEEAKIGKTTTTRFNEINGFLTEMAENSHDISYRENQTLLYRLEH